MGVAVGFAAVGGRVGSFHSTKSKSVSGDKMKNEHIEMINEMIVPYKENAKNLLNPDADFSEVCYRAKTDKKYGTYDGNHINRYRILTGIRFIRDSAPYEELIRYLLVEEIKDRETNSFQGIGDALNLAVWLTKQFHKEEDAELFSRAKNANFDTACGFNANDLSENYFKTNICDFDIVECIWLTLDLQEHTYYDRLLELWKSEQTEWNEKRLNQLRSFERQRKNVRGELAALLKLFELKKRAVTDWDYCSLSNDIAEKQIELGQIQEAYDTVSRMLPRLEIIVGWENIGSGRFIMERCMDIIISGNKQDASHLWNYMKPHAVQMKHMHWKLHEKIAKAAEIMGDLRLSKLFIKQLDKEKKASRLALSKQKRT